MKETKLQHESKKRKKEQRELEKRVKCEKTRTQEERGREGFGKIFYNNTLYFFPHTEEGPSHSARIKRERERKNARTVR